MLQGSRVVAIVGQLEPAGMAKHVRVDREWHLGGLPEALDEAVKTDGADWGRVRLWWACLLLSLSQKVVSGLPGFFLVRVQRHGRRPGCSVLGGTVPCEMVHTLV